MSAEGSETSAIVPTPLGQVTVRACGPSAIEISATGAQPPKLPPDMDVDGTLLLRIDILAPITNALPLQITISTHLDGYAETGEWLESINFSDEGNVLQIATRDYEWLAGSGIESQPAQYDRHGFTHIINTAPAGAVLHFSLVWRTYQGAIPEHDASAWFAADLALPEPPKKQDVQAARS